MILQKLSNKVNPKKNIHRSSWKYVADKIASQQMGAWGWGMGKEERRKNGGLGNAWKSGMAET